MITATQSVYERNSTTQTKHTTTIRRNETILETTSTTIEHEQGKSQSLTVKGYIDKYNNQLRGLPAKKLKRVQHPAWYATNYGQEVKEVLSEMKEDEFIRDALEQPLVHAFKQNYAMGADLLHKKLLLRNFKKIAEFPRLLRVNSVREEIVPPSGYEINESPLSWGLSSDMEKVDKKVLASCDFEIGDLIHNAEFEIEFLMSLPMYGHICCGAYSSLVIDKNIHDTEQAYLKWEAEQYKKLK